MNPLARILAVTDEVERLVSEGRWSEANVAEAQRYELIVAYAASSACCEQELRSLQERSRMSLALALRRRGALVADANRELAGARGIGAYERVAADLGQGPTGETHGRSRPQL